MKYLLIKGMGGLGNRMLAAASGLLYAQITGRRPIVDWSDPNYSDDGSDTFHRYFDAPAIGRRDEIPETASVAPESWRGRLHGHPRDEWNTKPLTAGALRAINARTSADLLRTDQSADVLVMWSFRDRIDLLRPQLRGDLAHLAHLPTDAIIRGVMEMTMPPREEVMARVARFRRERMASPAVGVHVRYTDFRSRLPAIRRRLDRLLAEKTGLEVFLATDNASVRGEFERSYGAVSTPHRYPEAGASLHLGPERTNRFELGVEALVDLHLLAGCEYLIGDGASSFTRIAMLLSSAEPSRISNAQDLRSRWHLPIKAVWRHTVPGPAAPLAVAVARRLAR